MATSSSNISRQSPNIREEFQEMSHQERTSTRGFHDYSEGEQVAFDRCVKIIQSVFERHGFPMVYPRPVEPITYLCKNAGGQEIAKQVFGVARLTEHTITHLGLPFDRTVPLASWILRHAREVCFPYKRGDIGISWRGEHPQPERYLAFYQCDVDIIHHHITPLADAEVVATMYDVLEELQIGEFQIVLNHIHIAKAMIDTLDLEEEAQKEAVLRIVDKMEKLPIEEIERQILEITGPTKEFEVQKLIQFFNYRGSLENFELDPAGASPAALDGLEQLHQIFSVLQQLGVRRERLSFCPGLVRGLEYYSGFVAETFLAGSDPKTGKSYKEYGSILSGGRYDHLVGALADPESSSANRLETLKGTGMSLGLTRLFGIFLRHNLLPLDQKTTAEVMVGYRTQAQLATAIKAAACLRKYGIKVDLFSEEGQKIKQQLTYANLKGIPYAFLVMDESNSFVVKDLKNSSRENQIQQDCSNITTAVEIVLNNLGKNQRLL